MTEDLITSKMTPCGVAIEEEEDRDLNISDHLKDTTDLQIMKNTVGSPFTMMILFLLI